MIIFTAVEIPDPVTWAEHYLGLIATICGVIAAAGALVAWVGKRRTAQIKQIVFEATRPIQVDANGGMSLADANRKLDHMLEVQAEIREDVAAVKGLAEGTQARLDDHIALHQQDVPKSRLWSV